MAIQETALRGGEEIEGMQFPEAAPALADWIEQELGDVELAEFLRDHPEGAELCANGEAMLPCTIFDVIEDLVAVEPELAQKLAHTLEHKDMFPKLSYHRAVGDVGDAELADALLERKFVAAIDRISFREGEGEKTEHDRTYFQRANEALSQLRAKFGLPPLVVPEEAVRFISTTEEGFVNDAGEVLEASYSQMDQVANLSDVDTPPGRFNSIFHEFTHFHSYGAIQVNRTEDGGNSISGYRMGLTVRARKMKDKKIPLYLNSLNEAITEETANRLYFDIPLDDPELSQFAKHRHELAAYAENNCGDMIKRDGLRPHWISQAIATEDGGLDFEVAYAKERNVMFSLLQKIAEKNLGLYSEKSPEEAENELFEMLQKAMFTGNILPFGRLFNNTFGRGKFREFAHLQSTEEQQRFITAL